MLELPAIDVFCLIKKALLFVKLKEFGFDAVTFMPSRNTPEQLDRVMALCREHGFFMISGEDINQPRQSFICKAADAGYKVFILLTGTIELDSCFRVTI